MLLIQGIYVQLGKKEYDAVTAGTKNLDKRQH